MTPADKVKLIKRISKQLETESWTDLDLTLRQFDAVSSEPFEGNDKHGYCVHHIESASDNSLNVLADYLFGAAVNDSRLSGREPYWQANRFRLFLSHISGAKKFVSAVKTYLAVKGIDGFVAHEDIHPTKKWLEQIEIASETCDALAAVLTEGFHESEWTDHEIGFCVNRRVLVVPVRLGVDPYGFISGYQAYTPPSQNASVVANGLFDIFCKHDLTAEKMGTAIVSHFAESSSFVEARTNLKLLEYVKRWTPEMLREIELAVEKNDQIREAYNVPEAVRKIVRKHGK